MRTAVVTDSNSGILPAEGAALGVHIVSMPVIIDGKTYYENENISRMGFFDLLKRDRDISTSQPPVGALIEMFDEVLQTSEELIYIPMSSGLSGSCQSAILTAHDYDGKVEVADNRRISISQKQAVLRALKLAQEGRSAREIRETLEKEKSEAVIYLMVSSLTQFRKSGRITPAAAALGNLIHIHPVLKTDGGKFDVYTNAHGFNKAKSSMIRAVHHARTAQFGFIPDDQLYIAAADSFENSRDSEKWITYVREQFPDLDFFHSPLPLSIVCHTGADAIGIGMFPKP